VETVSLEDGQQTRHGAGHAIRRRRADAPGRHDGGQIASRDGGHCDAAVIHGLHLHQARRTEAGVAAPHRNGIADSWLARAAAEQGGVPRRKFQEDLQTPGKRQMRRDECRRIIGRGPPAFQKHRQHTVSKREAVARVEDVRVAVPDDS
jgi:hypothetical protein